MDGASADGDSEDDENEDGENEDGEIAVVEEVEGALPFEVGDAVEHDFLGCGTVASLRGEDAEPW